MSIAMWTIYHGARDQLAGSYRLRRSVIGPGTVTHDKQAQDFPSLDAARAAVPRGLHRMVRHPQDEPQIVETWF